MDFSSFNNIKVVNTLNHAMQYKGIGYEIISLPFTEKDSLNDYFCIARARVFDPDINMSSDSYTVLIGFDLSKDYPLSLKPVNIFIKNQITAAGNHVYAQTIPITSRVELTEV